MNKCHCLQLNFAKYINPFLIDFISTMLHHILDLLELITFYILNYVFSSNDYLKSRNIKTFTVMTSYNLL